MKTGMVAELADVATGIWSLNACGDPEKRSTKFPLRSVTQSPLEGAIRLTGCAGSPLKTGNVDSETFLACRLGAMEKLDKVWSKL